MSYPRSLSACLKSVRSNDFSRSERLLERQRTTEVVTTNLKSWLFRQAPTMVLVAILLASFLLACSSLSSLPPPAVPSLVPAQAQGAVKTPGITVYVVNEDADSVSVIDGASHQVVATISVGKWPHQVAFSPDGLRAYVTNGESGTISVIDTTSRQVLSSIPVGKDPQGLAVAPNGLVYVANYDSNDISVVDPAAGQVKATISATDAMEPMPNPQDVALSPDGKRAYVTNLRAGDILVIDTASNAVTARIRLVEGTTGIAVSPGGQFLYAGGHGAMGSMAMPGQAQMGTPMPGQMGATPSGGQGMAKGGTGEKNKDVRVVDLTTSKIISTIPCGIMPVAIAFAKDGQRAYVASHGSNEISVIDANTHKAITNIPVGKNPKGLAVSPDGRFVYVTNFDSNDVSVVDTASQKVVATIPVGKGPHGVAVKPD